VDAPLPSPDALVRPWRTATLVASLVAAIELVLLIGAAVMLLAKPLAHAVQRHAEAAALAPTVPTKKAPAVAHKIKKVPPAKHTRSHTGVFVLNGNGRNGAASTEAAKLSGLGYRVPGKGNAKRQDYATTVVMYRRGWEAEGRRLADDLHVKIVGPLDGMSSTSLHGAQTVVVLGAR
jgi:LytR cell envelope-related transcriptional attenuator